MEKLRSQFTGAASNELSSMGGGVSGFAGITPEMFQEFIKSNPDIGQGLIDQGKGYLDEEKAMGPYDFQGTYDSRLANLRALDAPLEDRYMMSNWDNQFGRGVLSSDTGGYQTEGIQRGFNAKDIQRHDTAFGQAMGLGDQYNNIRQMLQSAGLNFQGAGANDMASRFARAMEMFGTGQQAESLKAQRAQGFLGGASSIDQFLANLMTMQGNLAAQKSGSNVAAYAPSNTAALAADAQAAKMGGQIMGAAMSMIPGG
jgi:hypothetical protein